MRESQRGTRLGEYRYIKSNTLPTLWDKYSKSYMQDYIETHGIRRKAAEYLYKRIARRYLEIVFDALIEGGEDVRTPIGTFVVRQMKADRWKSTGYARDFTIGGGKKYGINDFMRKGNSYPTIFFNSDGQVIYRTVMWRMYLKVQYRLRRRLYEAFYDHDYEYKRMQWTPKKKKSTKAVWRHNQLIRVR